jgi:hypothetical protein
MSQHQRLSRRNSASISESATFDYDKQDAGSYAIAYVCDVAPCGHLRRYEPRLFNERGSVGLVLHVSDEVPQGVVLVPGRRPDDEAVSGTINMLCSDRYTDMGEGATYQSTSTFLDVAKWGA